MEITSSTVYWVLQLDHIHEALVCVFLFAVLFGIPAVLFSIAGVIDKKIKPFVVVIISVAVISILFTVAGFKIFLPSTKTAIAMYTIPKLVNSEAAKRLEGDAKDLYILGIETLKKELQK